MLNKNELIELGLKKRNGLTNLSWEEIGNKFGVSGESARCMTKKSLYKNKWQQKIDLLDNGVEYKESVEILQDGTQKSDKLIKMSLEQSKDVNFLLDAHGYDKNAWTLIGAKNNIWNVYSKQDGVQTLYSSKISVKPRIDNITAENIIEHLNKFSYNYQVPKLALPSYSDGNKMLEVNIADLHVGKLSWHGDSGENFDIKIAKERFLYVINDVIQRTKHYCFDYILLVFTNDFFHSDTIQGTTTAGTNLDCDGRWQNLFNIGIEMLIEGIDLLRQVAKVKTFYTGSNHDKMTSYYAIKTLEAWYRNSQDVEVDSNTQSRKYIEFGRCLIGFGHGDKEKKRIGYLMPIEAHEAWGRTTFREFHAAHFHKEQMYVQEENGIIVRYVSSPTSIDNWHYENGFVGATKKSQQFIWDRDYGLTDILHTTII